LPADPEKSPGGCYLLPASWEYEFSRMRSKPINFVPYVNVIYSGAEGDKKSLVIFFDKSRVVQQYTISTSKVDVSRGLITR
jgi:hypothetical protein